MADLYSLLKQFNAIGGMAQTQQSGFCLLMALWQKSNELNWTNKFTMTNAELLYKAGFNCEKTLIEVRNKVKQLGYFEYIKPKNRRQSGTYILNFDLMNSLNYLHDVNSEVSSGVSSDVSSEVNSEVSSDVNINITKQNSTNKKNIKKSYRDEFESIWKEYPKKVEKEYAYKKFELKVKKSGLDVVIGGIKAYIAEVKRQQTDKQFIKNLGTFLNKECYSDYQEEQPKEQDDGFNREFKKAIHRRNELEGIIDGGEDFRRMIGETRSFDELVKEFEEAQKQVELMSIEWRRRNRKVANG